MKVSLVGRWTRRRTVKTTLAPPPSALPKAPTKPSVQTQERAAHLVDGALALKADEAKAARVARARLAADARDHDAPRLCEAALEVALLRHEGEAGDKDDARAVDYCVDCEKTSIGGKTALKRQVDDDWGVRWG